MSKRKQIQRINGLEMITNFIINNKIKPSIFINTIFLYDILIKENNDLLCFEELSLGALILSL